jgi:hypothetical protein
MQAINQMPTAAEQLASDPRIQTVMRYIDAGNAGDVEAVKALPTAAWST